MFPATFKSLIITVACTLSLSVFAATDTNKEALLKGLNTRLQTLLRSSIEAQVFLDEDLTESVKLLSSSKINWVDSLSEYPFVITSQNGGEITLSKHLGFKGSPEAKTSLLVTMLFNIKRQLEVGTLPLPNFRIKIFSRKFSSYIFDRTDSCDISVFQLNRVHSSIKTEILTKTISKTQEKGFTYHSSRPAWILMITGKETTDTGCGGDNRNIYRLSAELLNMRTSETKSLPSSEGTSCGFSENHYKKAAKEFIKTINNQLPKCTQTLEF